MQITSDNFKSWYKADLQGAQLYMVERARLVVLQQYCNKLTARSACTGECKVCGARIQSALQWMTETPGIPKMSYGIFGKIMKTAFARRLEEMSQHTVELETNSLGERTDRDMFDIFAETLS